MASIVTIISNLAVLIIVKNVDPMYFYLTFEYNSFVQLGLMIHADNYIAEP